MRRVLREAAARFDWVIIDTPPLGLLPDAHLLAAMVDVAVVVIRAGRSPFRSVQRAIDAVGRERVAGIVLNGLEASFDDISSYTSKPSFWESRMWRLFAARRSKARG